MAQKPHSEASASNGKYYDSHSEKTHLNLKYIFYHETGKPLIEIQSLLLTLEEGGGRGCHKRQGVSELGILGVLWVNFDSQEVCVQRQ